MAGDRERQDKDQGWTRQEKARGAPRADTGNADAAGAAEPKAKPSSDRAETEGAVARIQQSTEPGTAPGKS
ncbi:MAG: hypothetical protein IRY87_00625 [Acetobacteraceae bacterium]|nr:hypothetical protein [Acetobacteraceae bacterium]